MLFKAQFTAIFPQMIIVQTKNIDHAYFTYRSTAEMEGGSTINSHSGGGSFGTSSSGIKGTGAVDFRTVYKNRTLCKQAGKHTT